MKSGKTLTDVTLAWLLESDELVSLSHKLLILWDSHTQPSLRLTESSELRRWFVD